MSVLGSLAPEIDRVHSVFFYTLIDTRVGSHADLPKPSIQDVGPMVRAVGPELEDGVWFSGVAVAPGEVLATDAPVEAKAPQTGADPPPRRRSSERNSPSRPSPSSANEPPG